MEDRDAAVEQRLDIDELPRPIPFLEHTLTESEATRAYLLRGPSGPGPPGRPGEERSAGQPKEPGRIHRRPAEARVIAFWAARAIMRDQDFSELQAAMRLDHHDLAPLEGGVALRKSGESPYLTHDAVADQIRVLAHSPLPSPWVDAGDEWRP